MSDRIKEEVIRTLFHLQIRIQQPPTEAPRPGLPGDDTGQSRITSYNVCYTKLLRKVTFGHIVHEYTERQEAQEIAKFKEEKEE